MMERAVLQDVVATRDGSVTRAYHRPDEVRAKANRVMSWRFGAADTCHNCGGSATAIRSDRAVCASCREQMAIRLAPILPLRGFVPESRETVTPESAIAGHFIVFNSRSHDLGGFVEVVAPEAVDRSLKGKTDIRALWSHDTSIPLGRTPKTLSLRKDKTGLWGEIMPPAWASNHVETVSRGDVSGASFGFVTLDDEFVLSADDGVLRTLFDITLHEISPVSFPAYPGTRIGITKPAERAQREFDTRLRLAR